MDGFGITCRCGHTDDYDAFQQDADGQPLPDDHYLCPDCGKGWALVTTGPAQILDNGLQIPAPRVVVGR